MMRFFLMLNILISSSCAFAMVNLRNGSYSEKWVDYIDPEAGIEMKIERYYSSRSLFIGVFGFGWCSKLETHLTITSDGIINLTECGGGLEVTYYPKNFESFSIDDTVNKILLDYKKNQVLTVSDESNLKTQLRSNTKMRFEHAKRLGLVDDKRIKQPGNSFYSKSKGVEKITFDGRVYQRKLFSGVTETYDKSGKLIQITEPTGQYLKVKYKGKLISYVVDDKGRRLTFTPTADGERIAKISNGKGLEVNYKYRNQNMVEVTNMWSKTYKFEYLPNHNMTRVDFPDGTHMSMTYDSDGKDLIQSYTNRKGCREEFNYIKDDKDSKNHYTVTFSRVCKGGPKYAGKHEFWYRTYPHSKNKYLQRVFEQYRERSKDVYFHTYLGRPISILENEIAYRGFSYFLNGLVNKREDKYYQKLNKKRELIKWMKTAFEYDKKSLRINKMEEKQLDAFSKVTSSRTLSIDYNRNGLISKATDQNKKFLGIQYDTSGKVEKLSNSEGDVIILTHKVGVDKPVVIEQQKVGLVKIAYDANGEVESLDSGGKRNLASSIIEKFLSMISFLGPLGENLKI